LEGGIYFFVGYINMSDNTIIEKKVRDWVQAAEEIKPLIDIYEEHSSTFWELYYMSISNATISRRIVESLVNGINKLANGLSNKEPELSTNLKTFSRICKQYYANEADFVVFKKFLEKEKIYAEIKKKVEQDKEEEDEIFRKQQEELRRREREKREREENERKRNEYGNQRESYERVKSYAPPKPSNYLGLAILSLFAFFLSGIVALYYATRVNPYYKKGNYQGAKQASKSARNWAVVSIGIVVIFFFVGVFFKEGDFKEKPTTSIEKPLEPNYYCTASSLNVRSTPSTNGTVLGKLSQSEEIYVYQVDITKDFAKIKYKENVAYVSNKYIQKIGTKPPVVSIQNTERISITRSESIIKISDRYDAHRQKAAVSASERSRLRIDDISCFPDKEYRTHIVKGKIILDKPFGRLETFLSHVEDHGTFEYLASYDQNGNFIDCMEIGTIFYYRPDRGSSIIEGDKIFYKVDWDEPGDEGGLVYIDYQITPQLTFREIARREERRGVSSQGSQMPQVSDVPLQSSETESSKAEGDKNTNSEKNVPKGSPWIALPSAFATQISKSYAGPTYSFSNGKDAAFVVLSSYSGGGPVLKYDISSKIARPISTICPDAYNMQRYTQPYAIVNNIVYLSVAKNMNGGGRWALERFDLGTEKMLPPVVSSKKAWSTASDAVLGFSIGNICFFIFDNGDVYSYDTITDLIKQMRGIGSSVDKSMCATFSIGNKAYLVTISGQLFEYQITDDRWIEQKNMNAKFLNGIHGFAMGGYGYIWGQDGSGDKLYKYDPANSSWTRCTNSPNKNVGKYKMAFPIDNRYAILGSGPGKMECFIYDSYLD